MLESTGAFVLETAFPASATPESVLRILHDHGAMFGLSPLVKSHRLVSPSDDVSSEPPSAAVSPDTAKPLTYEVTEAIPLLPGGLWTTNSTSKVELTNLPDGLRTVEHAGAGIEGTIRWTVGRREKGEGGGDGNGAVWLREEAEVRCNMFLVSFVKWTMKKSHVAMHKKLLEVWGEKEEGGH
ncbi:hypothetical protein GP486_006243 [Trichoglossum hirsutum]|uniref:DUF7053 domain-containing protein n=1 Tax=Trichoglossum hirsutum TaxID=265104 RepID=A0A9P8L7I1_9PEZI|nr:hypothetical protein GP486_006243 [Trichoglossum hirsutum]